jgi:hypothetical protein
MGYLQPKSRTFAWEDKAISDNLRRMLDTAESLPRASEAALCMQFSGTSIVAHRMGYEAVTPQICFWPDLHDEVRVAWWLNWRCRFMDQELFRKLFEPINMHQECLLSA